jgi:hypothetical protein
MKGNLHIRQNTEQAVDMMSRESVENLVECLLYKVAVLRKMEQDDPKSMLYSLDSERSTISKFLTALLGSGFNHTVRNQKGTIAYDIEKELEELSPNEVLAKTNDVTNCIYGAL